MPLVLSIVVGFVLMWPLGWLFGVMNWPVFHSWGLAHGSFVLAWPMLSAFCFLVGWPLSRALRRRAS
jgi:hypothetical protein